MTIFPSVPLLLPTATALGVTWPVGRGPPSFWGESKCYDPTTTTTRLPTAFHLTRSFFCTSPPLVQDGGCRQPARAVRVWAVRAVWGVLLAVHHRQTAAVLQQLGPAQRHPNLWLETAGWGRSRILFRAFAGAPLSYFTPVWFSCCRCGGRSRLWGLLFLFPSPQSHTSAGHG